MSRSIDNSDTDEHNRESHIGTADDAQVPDADVEGLRISARVDRMWELGFVEEVEQLLKDGITSGRTAQLALGYSQLIAFKNGLLSEEEAKEDTKRATRQYARRQETWFSRDDRIKWISQAQPRLETVLQHLEKIN